MDQKEIYFIKDNNDTFFVDELQLIKLNRYKISANFNEQIQLAARDGKVTDADAKKILNYCLMMMIKSDISEIVNKCYKYYDLSYPVDLTELSKKLSIKFLHTDLDSEGYFINKSGNLYILLRQNIIDAKRQRFTFAHEIGHALLYSDSSIISVDDNKEKYFNYEKEIDTIEKQANYFASELLCPSKNLKNELPNKTLTFSFIDRIADKYQISRQTAAIKCVEHSKTENELLIFYDENNEIRWYISKDTELKYNHLPNDLANVESFIEGYYDNLEQNDSYFIG